MCRSLLLGGIAVALAIGGGLFWALHASQQQPNSAWQAALARGRYDFSTGSCISCHALSGISTAGGGADLTHESNRRSLAWLQHEIRFPTSIRPPTPPGQADDLAAFLSAQR